MTIAVGAAMAAIDQPAPAIAATAASAAARTPPR